MGKEMVFLGVAGLIVGVVVWLKTGSLVPSLVPFVLGLALIIFNKGEGEVEQRKDKV